MRASQSLAGLRHQSPTGPSCVQRPLPSKSMLSNIQLRFPVASITQLDHRCSMLRPCHRACSSCTPHHQPGAVLSLGWPQLRQRLLIQPKAGKNRHSRTALLLHQPGLAMVANNISSLSEVRKLVVSARTGRHLPPAPLSQHTCMAARLHLNAMPQLCRRNPVLPHAHLRCAEDYAPVGSQHMLQQNFGEIRFLYYQQIYTC